MTTIAADRRSSDRGRTVPAVAVHAGITGPRNNGLSNERCFFYRQEKCTRRHRNDNSAKVCQATAAAVDQRAAARLHVQGLGSAVEECPGETVGRSESQNQWK